MLVSKPMSLALCLAACTLDQGWGQAQAPSSQERSASAPLYTLHVYEDLVQVTALAMTPQHEVDTHLRPEDLFIQLDAGPPFHPRHLRLEGDDPISLTVVLDESWEGAEEETRSLEESFTHLAPGLLTAQDRVSIFGFDCNLLMSAKELPALSPGLPSLFPKLLHSAALHAARDGRSRCDKSVSLWDALGAVGQQLESVTGRRVLLVVSPGLDAGSVNRPDAVRHFLAGEGATVFGAVPTEGRRGPASYEPPFVRLCVGTGGLVTSVKRERLSGWLEDTLKLLRERYVLEFARPTNQSIGLHQIVINTRNKAERIYVSGALVPLRDMQLDKDPYTVPNAPDRAPVMGNRKILTPP